MTNVHVSIVHFARQWQGEARLDGRVVENIASDLTEGLRSSPHKLKSTFPSASGGTGLLGIGFVIDAETYHAWVDRDPRYKEVLWPYINGKELNSTFDFSPQRYVINFGDRSETEAEQYPLAIERVRRLVKPQRDVLTRQVHEASYWKHWDKRAGLYRDIETRELQRVIVCSFVSKHLPFTFLPSGWVYSKELVVVPSDDAADFGVLQSTLHMVWARHQSGTLKSDLSYSISDALRTFPLPIGLLTDVRAAGEEYFQSRRDAMSLRREGLTTLYNRFHSRSESSPDMARLRESQARLDCVVTQAYGWAEVDLNHGFHETKQGLRFTISDVARRELLKRLFELNHQRFLEEVEQGLQEEGSLKAKRPAKGKKAVRSSPLLEEA